MNAVLLAEVLPDIDLAAVAAEKLYGFMLRLFRLADAFEAFFGFFTGHSAVGVGYDGSNSLYGVFVGRGMSGRLIGLIAVLLLAYFAVSSLMSAAASGYRKRKLIRVSLKKMFVFIITVAAVLVPANLAAMVLSKTREIFFMPPYPSVGAGFYAALFTRQADLDAQAVPYWFQPYDDMASDPGRVMIYAGVALGLFVAVTAIISSLLFIKRMAGAVICLVSSPPVMRDGSEEGAYVFARWRDRFVSTAWSGLSCAYVLKALFLFASFLLSGNQLFSGQEDSNALAAVLIIGAACLVALSLIFLSDAALVRRGAVRVFFVWKARRRLSTAAEYRIPLWNGVLASGEDFIYRHIKTSGVLIGLSGFACATLAYMTNGPVKYYLVPAAV
ncbi:MAG: hypothetical protein LBV27_09645, partial [Oscillospiraceae bacterium]|nr:hypothetical protein [Oscillospiraceae bacterium]